MAKEPIELVDLDPQDWTSEREKPKEPFFGAGLLPFLAYVAGFLTVAATVGYFRGLL